MMGKACQNYNLNIQQMHIHTVFYCFCRLSVRNTGHVMIMDQAPRLLFSMQNKTGFSNPCRPSFSFFLFFLTRLGISNQENLKIDGKACESHGERSPTHWMQCILSFFDSHSKPNAECSPGRPPGQPPGDLELCGEGMADGDWAAVQPHAWADWGPIFAAIPQGGTSLQYGTFFFLIRETDNARTATDSSL